MYRRILLLTGPSSDSDDAGAASSGTGMSGSDGERGRLTAAAQRAAAIARAAAAELEVFDPVCEPALAAYQSMDGVHDPVRERLLAARRSAAGELAALVADQVPHVTAAAEWGERVDRSVARRVLERDADLVVIAGGSRASGSSGADWRVVAMCPVPVLVVRGSGDVAFSRVIAAVDPQHAHAKPAELELAVLQHAQAFSNLFEAPLDIVHSYLPLSMLATGLGADLAMSDAQQAFDASLQGSLRAMQSRAGADNATVRLLTGRPEVTLRALAAQEPLALIVMGALSRSGWKRLLIGSTAERFLRHADGDVLFVNPPGMSFAE
jgi:universal stress protein E